MTEARAPVLSVRDFSLDFAGKGGALRAVSGVSFEVGRGETLAVVGESGCGKSVTALSILGLLPRPPARVAGGAILLCGQDVTRLGEREMQRLRGDRVSIVFQEPMTALNPVMRVGDQIAEVLIRHGRAGRREALPRALDLLRQVRIADPEQRLRQYPHELSGGMRQQVVIAIALAYRPDLLVADEPTTALDVTVQAQILALVDDLKRQHDTAVLLITHDLGVVAQAAQRVAVMYAGRIVESAGVADLLARPRHPYTLGLVASIPRRGANRRGGAHRLAAIPGTVPPLGCRGEGCAFRDRCPRAVERCAREVPPLAPLAPAHEAACFRPVPDGLAA